MSKPHRNPSKPALAPSFELPLQPINVPVERCPVSRDEASERILIMRLAAHGDILMATPLLRAIREQRPNAHITWVAERKERQAIDAHPIVDELLLWDSPYFKRMLRRANYLGWAVQALRFRKEIRGRHFDSFVSFQPEEWPLLMLGSGAPRTIGIFDTFRAFYRSKKASPYTRLYLHAFTHEVLPAHRTDQYLLSLPPLGLNATENKLMQMGFTAEDQTAARAFVASEFGGDTDRYAILAPMTTWETRCWPPERFAALGDRIAKDGRRIVLISSAHPREAAVAQAVAGQMQTKAAIASGNLTFRQMAAMVSEADLLISGDTGPMHVAAAVGTPYLALFGPTPVENLAPLAGPGRVLRHAVPCGPCYQKTCALTGSEKFQCMRLITVDEVYEAYQDLAGFEGSPPQPLPGEGL